MKISVTAGYKAIVGQYGKISKASYWNIKSLYTVCIADQNIMNANKSWEMTDTLFVWMQMDNNLSLHLDKHLNLWAMFLQASSCPGLMFGGETHMASHTHTSELNGIWSVICGWHLISIASLARCCLRPQWQQSLRALFIQSSIRLSFLVWEFSTASTES